MHEMLSFLKWPLIAILGIVLLYISARVIGAGWFKSRSDYIRALAKSTRKGVK